MSKEEIDDIVCNIMVNDGPDGHVDGHEIITDFIMALMEGDPNEWVSRYRDSINQRENSTWF